jgi:putative sterol carrier protein
MFETPQQVFDAMPPAFQRDKAGPVELALNFSVGGEGGGEWWLQIEDGECRVAAGQLRNPTATIRMSAEDLVAVFGGSLNAVAAYMSGRVKVTGDVTAIMNVLSFFDFPGDA